jgi:hypothetical protein
MIAKMEPFTTIRLCLTHTTVVDRFRDTWCRYSDGDEPPCEVRVFALLPLDVD